MATPDTTPANPPIAIHLDDGDGQPLRCGNVIPLNATGENAVVCGAIAANTPAFPRTHDGDVPDAQLLAEAELETDEFELQASDLAARSAREVTNGIATLRAYAKRFPLGHAERLWADQAIFAAYSLRERLRRMGGGA